MTETLALDLPILLPEIPHLADSCVERLIRTLAAKAGVEQVHVLPPGPGEAAKLCIHFDPTLLPLSRLREMAEAAGAEISTRFAHALWPVSGITHQRRARFVGESLSRVTGVIEALATATGLVSIEYDRTQISESEVVKALEALGVRRIGLDHHAGPGGIADEARPLEAAPTDHAHDHAHDHDHDHAHGLGGLLGHNTELIFAVLCGLIVASAFVVSKIMPDEPGWLPWIFGIAAYGVGGAFPLMEALENLRRRAFEIDTLMIVAAAGAAVLGSWMEGALLLFLFSLGHALEHYAMGRAKRAIAALAELAPATATVRRDGTDSDIPVEQLLVGDLVLVRPNERLPADGFVVKGTSAVNQAPITGESIPVDKQPVPNVEAARARPEAVEAASRVFAGTINGAGAIEVEVSRLASDTALAKVIEMVSEAETQKSPTQRFTDRVERLFVPAVLVTAAVLLFAWVVIAEPFRTSFYRAMAFLVAASPCALAIATPSAVLSGVARAARSGVLVKGGAPLENLGSLRAVAFDKTGTLTEGRPRITDIVAVNGVSEDELLAVAVAVETLSDHPLARAIAKDGRERLGRQAVLAAGELESLTGRGVRAQLQGEMVWIGKAEMFGDGEIPALKHVTTEAVARLRETGRTTMVVRRGNRDMGVIGLMDAPRAGARQALAQLRALGIQRMIMISGDHQKVAETIARDVGLDEAWGDLMPDAKVKAIKTLAADGKVAMVGDGVNDAPAMASATVGVAMGAAGSDVALETADVALMADDLARLPFAIGLSRTTRQIIRQNVFVSLGVVAILAPATIFGLGIGPAVAVHEGSTLVVVINALRLLAYRGPAGSTGTAL